METNNMFYLKLTRMLVFLCLFLVSSNLFAKAGPTAAEYGVVLNLSGKQRMLTQKMSKEVLLIALNQEKSKNLQNLKKTSSLFDRTLIGLKTGDQELGLPQTTSKRINRQLEKTKKLWVPFKAQVETILKNSNATVEDVKVVAETNLPLLQNMNRCVKLYERDASKSGLKADPGLVVTINLAGKQRMLTQKMSKEFLLIAYGYKVEENRLNLSETATLFERTLKGLKDGDETLDLPGTKQKHILDQLEIVEKLWNNFKPHVEFATNTANKTIPEDNIKALAEMNLPLLKEMNKTVKLYEKEAGS